MKDAGGCARRRVLVVKMRKFRRTTHVLAATAIVAAVGVAHTGGKSSADPSGHEVTYTITSTAEVFTSVAFMVNQPKDTVEFADRSTKYLYSLRPKINPDAPWRYTTRLANPERWAWVSAGQYEPFLLEHVPADVAAIDYGYHCEVAIDGHVVATGHGSRELTCGTRPITDLVPDLKGTFPP